MRECLAGDQPKWLQLQAQWEAPPARVEAGTRTADRVAQAEGQQFMAFLTAHKQIGGGDG